MALKSDLIRLSLEDFRTRIKGEMIPLSNRFSYFAAAVPLQEDDIRDYLEDPIAALPPRLVKMLPPISVLLVPFLERSGNGKDKKHTVSSDLVTFEKPSNGRELRSLVWIEDNSVVMAFGVQELEAADYHYELFHQVAWLVAELYGGDERSDYETLLREEVNLHVHGEVDEKSWQSKQAMLRKPAAAKAGSKTFKDYARLSFIDTLTLYLHGICCDIDVEPGPRQLPSRYLRQRLKLLKAQFGPPKGYAVFPEDQDPSDGVSGQA